MIQYSVIVPNRNHPALLIRALASIPVREDLEVIVVDDASDPAQMDMAHYPGLERADCQVIFTTEGKGAGYARNVGLDHARGRWLLFLDADDFFTEGILPLLDSHKDGTEDIIFFGITSVYSDTLEPSPRHESRTAPIARYRDNPAKLEAYCRNLWPEPWGKMIRRSMVLDHGICFDQTACANDVMFSALIGRAARAIAYDPRVLYCVTSREGSLSEPLDIRPEKAKDRLTTYWRVQQLYDREGVPFHYFYTFYRECIRKGGEAERLARQFVREQRIPRWKLSYNCAMEWVRRKVKGWLIKTGCLKG